MGFSVFFFAFFFSFLLSTRPPFMYRSVRPDVYRPDKGVRRGRYPSPSAGAGSSARRVPPSRWDFVLIRDRQRRRVPWAKRPSRVCPRNSCKPKPRLVQRNLGMFIALPFNRVNFGFSRSLGSRPTCALRWNRTETDRADHGYCDCFRRKNLCFQRVVRSGLVEKLKKNRVLQLSGAPQPGRIGSVFLEW